MPYITKRDRARFDPIIKKMLDEIVRDRFDESNFEAGELNYIISKIVTTLFEKKKNYKQANSLMGVLECVKQEFYRRHVAPYEDSKILENGDLEIT